MIKEGELGFLIFFGLLSLWLLGCWIFEKVTEQKEDVVQ